MARMGGTVATILLIFDGFAGDGLEYAEIGEIEKTETCVYC